MTGKKKSGTTGFLVNELLLGNHFCQFLPAKKDSALDGSNRHVEMLCYLFVFISLQVHLKGYPEFIFQLIDVFFDLLGRNS